MKTHRLLISFACLAVRVYGGLPMALPVEPAATEQPQVSVQAPAANPTPANDGPLLPNTKPAKKAPARWRGEMIDPQPATDDIIRLSSGDGVAGRLLRLTDTGVEWQLQLPVINKPIHFRSTGIHSIQLAAAADKAAGPAPRWVVRLTNGDWLVGDDLTLDATQVEVTTATGRHQVPRAFVAELQRNGVGATLPYLEHPNHWQQTPDKRPVRFKDVPLPEAGEAIFTLRADSRQQLNIQLFSDMPRLGACSIELAGSNLEMVGGFSDMVVEGVQTSNGQVLAVPLRPLAGRTTVDVGVRWDSGGQAAVVVNGEVKVTGTLIRDETVPSSGVGMSPAVDSFMFMRSPLAPYPYADVAPYLRVRRLPGLLPLVPPAPEADRVQFANAESLDGTLEAIDAQKIVLSGPFGRLELPVERFALGQLAVAKQQQPELPAEAVRVGFRDGCEITAVVTEVAETEWTLNSAMLGNLSVARQAVSRLDWSGDWNFTSIPTSAAESARPGAIQLLDGTQLPGTLNGFGAGTVHWRLPGAEQTVEFPLANIVRLSTTIPRWRERLPAVVVELITGDQISGELLEIDAEVARLRPVNALDPVAIRRPLIKQLRLNRAEAQVHWLGDRQLACPLAAVGERQVGSVWWEGADTLEHWLRENQTASQKLALSERTAVRLELPYEMLDKARFTAVVTGQSAPQGATATAAEAPPIMLLTNTVLVPIRGGYRKFLTLFYSPNPLHLRQHFDHDIQLTPGQTLFLTWLFDPNEQAMYLLNGRQIAMRVESRIPLSKGAQIKFSANLPARLVSSISPWRGSLDALGNDPPATPDWVLLDDLTVVDGTLTSVRDGQVTVTGEGKPSQVPLDRVARITFNPAEWTAAPPAGAVRVYVRDGDRVTLTDLRYNDNAVRGTVEGIGAVTVPVSAIVRMEF